MEYKVCENCKEVVEVKRELSYEGGSSVIKTTCPNCGYVKVETKNHVHYGNDAIKR